MVIGIEGRRELVRNAVKSFEHYEIPKRSYRFYCGDIFKVLARKRLKVDVVLCFGFLYHTLRYPELFHAISAMRPTHLILDTKVALSDRPVIKVVRPNNAQIQAHAIADAYSNNLSTLAGWPSLVAMERMLNAYEFATERQFDWAALTEGSRAAVGDYGKGERVTVRYRRKGVATS